MFLPYLLQTPGFWTEDGGEVNVHKRSASWGSADHLIEVCVNIHIGSFYSLKVFEAMGGNVFIDML